MPRIRAERAPEPADEEPSPQAWLATLRAEDAPTILTCREAALLVRVGKTESAIEELIRCQRAQADHGNPPANPFPYVRLGRKIRVPKAALLRWIERECELGGKSDVRDAR